MKLVVVAAFAVFAAGAAFAATGAKVPLWPDGKMPSPQLNQPEEPYLVWHVPERKSCDAVMIAVSGGGYGWSGVVGFEVSPIRDYLLAKGMTVVTMKYCAPRPEGLPKHLTAWQDAQRAVRIVRSEAKARGLDPQKIGFTGCSAGGHLALMAAVSSKTSAYKPVDAIDELPCNVNFAVPVYPAYVLADGLDRQNARRGNDLSDGLAPELEFDDATPPMCLFHGDRDGWSAMNSVRVYHKLRTMGLPAELHVMALENHCFQSNPRPGTPAATWKDRVWEWLVSLDFVTGHPQVWKKGWEAIVPGKSLAAVAEFLPGAWRTTEWGNAVLTAEKDDVLWLKGEWKDFELDFEYKIGADATHPAGQWKRLTVRVQGKSVQVVGNAADTSQLLSFSQPDVPNGGHIGFKGGCGQSRPSFRCIAQSDMRKEFKFVRYCKRLDGVLQGE